MKHLNLTYVRLFRRHSSFRLSGLESARGLNKRSVLEPAGEWVPLPGRVKRNEDHLVIGDEWICSPIEDVWN